MRRIMRGREWTKKTLKTRDRSRVNPAWRYKRWVWNQTYQWAAFLKLVLVLKITSLNKKFCGFRDCGKLERLKLSPNLMEGLDHLFPVSGQTYLYSWIHNKFVCDSLKKKFVCDSLRKIFFWKYNVPIEKCNITNVQLGECSQREPSLPLVSRWRDRESLDPPKASLRSQLVVSTDSLPCLG